MKALVNGKLVTLPAELAEEFQNIIEPEIPSVKSWDRALDFKLEFTEAERRAIRNFAKKDLVAEDFLDLLNSSGRIVADDPLLLQGLGYMVSKGVLTQERIDEVLGNDKSV